VVFLLISRLLGDKGIREYVAAAGEVLRRYRNVVFRLAGNVDTNPNSIQLDEVFQWHRAGVIEYMGQLDDVRTAIADCSVFVLPSYREGTPRAILEAMAMGRPIITTDAPGCRETVTDGDNGLLVPVKAVKELAIAMERFIVEPDLIPRMGARSRIIAVDKYDVHKVNSQMLTGMGILKQRCLNEKV
jgi:glycosyltransferase involved in cell wall biosynthesis